MPFKSDKRLYHTADKSRLVEESDPEAAFLFVASGQTVSDEDAKKYGLEAPAAPAEPKANDDDAEAKADAKPAATKAEAKAPATKAVTRKSTK